MLIDHFLIVEVNETNVYLASCRQTRQAAIIDAGGFSADLARAVRENDLSVRYLLVTHDHFDHTDALPEYLRAFPECEVLAAASRSGGVPSRQIADDQVLELGNLSIRALFIPGHTGDSTAWHFTRGEEGPAPSVSVVFCGDALFAGSVGGTHGETARNQELNGIRDKIFTLPPDTLIFPGHGPASTIAVESRHNPFF
ncbi:MBL fold metallo-hydrolase [bacterium]|nr:MBL fold metallo-hydrolase [bacterium]